MIVQVHRQLENILLNQLTILFLDEIMPNMSADILVKEISEGRAVNLSMYEKQILTILRSLTPSGIAKLPHVTPGLEYRLYKNALEFTNINEVIDNTISSQLLQEQEYNVYVLQRF